MKITNINIRKGHKFKSYLKFVVLSTMIFVFSLVFANESFAQSGRNTKSGGWGIDNQYDRMYDAKNIETVVGVLIKVEKITPFKRMSSGVHWLVKTDNEIVSVHLGPKWYIDNQDMEVVPKNKVEIKGSRITYQGKPAFIAAEIITENEILVLRSEDGTPVWRSWRKR